MPSSRPPLVLLGSGFGAFSLLKTIKHGLYDITVVSPRNHFLFTPLLPSTTVGTIEFRSIIEPIRAARPDAQYYQAYCTEILPEKNLIRCKSAIDEQEFELHYAVLVIAVGAENNTYNISGVYEHALFLKELNDARTIRQRIIENFEHASQPNLSDEKQKRLLHFVVVGGGPTGVEFAAEMHDFLISDLKKLYPSLAEMVRITLLEAREQILNTFDAALSEYTSKHFKRQNIDVRTNSIVSRVEKEKIILKDGTILPYGLIVWSTGIGPTSFVQSLSFPKDAQSRLLTNEYFNITENIYAIGDCATINGKYYPATSQVAQQEGNFLAKQLERKILGKPLKPFRYKHYGMLAYIGSEKALADLSAFKGRGFTTWLFWRSVYLTKLVSIKNKILVIFDWLKTFFFGRDISRF
jgi:NADH:ubiquinone reductase (non-electrogenic)